MEQLFSIGHQILSFFQAIVDLEQYPEWIQQGWPIGLGILTLLAIIYMLKGRRRSLDRRQQLEALEEALLDDDIEAKSLELPDLPPSDNLYEEFLEDEDYSEFVDEDPIPEPLKRTLARDPEFGGQIIIAATSSRKPTPEPDEDSSFQETVPMEQTASIAEIDEEFAQFAQELQEKSKEVQRRHQIEDDLMENEIFEEDFAEPESTGPIALSALDILPDEKEDSSNDWNEELEGLLEKPRITGKMNDEDILDNLYENESIAERDPLEIKERNERLIQRLEEFQNDFESKIQSRTLSQIAQKNFELVESLSDSEQTREYQSMKRNQLEALSSLESMVFGMEKKKR